MVKKVKNKKPEYKGITLGCGKCTKKGRKGAGKKSMIRNDILTIKKK